MTLEGVDQPALLTSVAVVAASELEAGSRAADCVRRRFRQTAERRGPSSLAPASAPRASPSAKPPGSASLDASTPPAHARTIGVGAAVRTARSRRAGCTTHGSTSVASPRTRSRSPRSGSSPARRHAVRRRSAARLRRGVRDRAATFPFASRRRAASISREAEATFEVPRARRGGSAPSQVSVEASVAG